MAKSSFASYLNRDWESALRYLAGIFGSGKNPDGSTFVVDARMTGATNIAIGNVTAGAASGAAVASRATRRSVLIRNEHATDSARVGPGTVTSSVGFLLKAGEAVQINTVAAVNAIRTGSADVALSFIEEYD